ncbi:ATP-binding protein [Chitinophaga sancti]|uniref:AAA family ATPase n=2 Tax=Chitinophaga TaxID=79328 RepID=UPI002A75C691|nr:ATP-binding protein [Chitinophaga sancti]WPQ63587.1 ATP-binding protein [Chitinophaga sancti]
MFIEFHFGNFRSFRDLQKFSLEATPLRSNDSGLEEGHVFEEQSLRLLKSKAIFGSNASGKSNLAKAMAAFCFMVSRSVAVEGIPKGLWNDRFQLLSNWDDQPVFFQYIMLHKSIVYRYGFQILSGKVTYEWLYSGTGEHQAEIFMRTPEGMNINEKELPAMDNFIKQAQSGDSELFRTDSLFLTAAALSGNKFLGGIRDDIRRIMAVDGVYDDSALKYAMTAMVEGDEQQKEAIKSLLRAADTGIEDLEIAELPEHLVELEMKKEISTSMDGNKRKPVSLFSVHSKFNEEGEVVDKIIVPFGEWESEGTAKLFSVGALILEALWEGRIIIIDEFDARFHPNLTLKIVELFNNSETNPRHAQLIFVTHDASLLKRAKLRRDQICFVNKDKYGISTLTNLIEYKGVRKDASYDKEYLNGSYSAIPYLDKIDWVVKHKSDQDGI